MASLKQKIIEKANLYGFDVSKFKSTISGWSFYNRDKATLIKQKGDNTDFPFGKPFPILNERTETAGTMSGHYFHQDLYMAKQVFKANPSRHLDIGSRIDGFIAHVASFREIEVMDIRPQQTAVENIVFKQADLMILPDDLLNAYDSISSLHVIEHFGLGRYGDPIDYKGHLKAFDNIGKMLKKGGTFYFSTPIGKQRIEFNAHRIFSVEYLKSIFEKSYEIKRFSIVNDEGDLELDCPLDKDSVANNYNFNYGCGMFTLIKK